MKRKILIFIIVILIMTIILYSILYHFNVVEHKAYSNDYFNIKTYISTNDQDNDGIDDQTDILNNARDYIATKPKYKSKYYATGYSNDEFGTCTDVIAISLLNAGYDLMELVDNDIRNNKDNYNIEIIDKNIDFKRVKNLNIYFKNNAISLTTDIYDIDSWQGGDIVVFEGHIAIVSDKRNKKGIPFIIHHSNPYQIRYEEDVLENYKKIIGHYRIS